MDRLLLATAGATAVGLVLLGVLAHTQSIPTPALADVGDNEGERVCVEARLAQLRTTPTGGTRFLLVDTAASLPGWAGFPWSAIPGDEVRACGALERRGHALELHPHRAGDLAVLRAWDATATPLGEIAARPWDYADQHRVVWAILTETGLRRQTLTDPGSGARLPVAGAYDAPLGEWARFEGRVAYEPDEARFRFAPAAPGDAA